MAHSPYYWENGYLPIPLRDGLTVFLKDIPWDLTKEEAKRIAAIVEALADREEATPSPPSQPPSP